MDNYEFVLEEWTWAVPDLPLHTIQPGFFLLLIHKQEPLGIRKVSQQQMIQEKSYPQQS